MDGCRQQRLLSGETLVPTDALGRLSRADPGRAHVCRCARARISTASRALRAGTFICDVTDQYIHKNKVPTIANMSEFREDPFRAAALEPSGSGLGGATTSLSSAGQHATGSVRRRQRPCAHSGWCQQALYF